MTIFLPLLLKCTSKSPKALESVIDKLLLIFLFPINALADVMYSVDMEINNYQKQNN